MTKYTEKELFETVPVPRAVATLAIPTIISQVVAMIYNLADTFFIGQIGNPYMVAAVSLVFPWFNLLTALDNLSNMVIVKLASAYGDIPVAAYGVVKKIDQFPLNVSWGFARDLCHW